MTTPKNQTLAGAPPGETLAPSQITSYGTGSFYGDALLDDKGRTSFLREVVSLSRKSPEYRRYRQFLIENVDMDRCSILSGLGADESTAAGLEIHHFPLSLYDVAELVLGQMESEGARITTFAVANRVMAEHWRGRVGLVPVTQTIHEAAHAGQVHIHPRSVYGDWAGLLEGNRAGLSEHLAEKLRAIAVGWEGGVGAEVNARALALAPQRWAADAPGVRDLLAGPGGVADGTE